MPTATGIDRIASAENASMNAESRRNSTCKPSPITDSVIQVATRVAENASHLICWRSSPLARRNRTNNEAAESTPSTTSTRNPNPMIPSATGPSASIPMGLPPGTPSSACGLTAPNRTMTPVTATEATATGRHLGEGSWPSGKSRKSSVMIGPIPAPHAQLAIHAAHIDPGSGVERPSVAYCEYPSVTKAKAITRVEPINTHPIGFSGWRDAISAPLNPIEAKMVPRPRFPRIGSPLMATRTLPETNSANEDAQSAHGSRDGRPACRAVTVAMARCSHDDEARTRVPSRVSARGAGELLG